MQMEKIILQTRRPWNWKVFLVLAGLVIPAVFALVPFTFYQLNTYSETGAIAVGWQALMGDALINAVITILLGGIGLVLANRIGLGMPYVEGWARHKPVHLNIRSALSISWIAGAGIAIVVLIFESLVFAPAMAAMFAEIGYKIPEGAITPPVYGLLAAFSAGITEETTFRLFGLSLLAWLGGLLFHDTDKRPNPAVFWGANILFALAFGAMHLPAARSLGWPINTLVVTRTIVLNGMGGLVLGWLFWKLGLETAMLAHFSGDVVRYVFLPIIALQTSQAGKYLALAGLGILLVLSLVWAWRTVVKQRQNQPNQAESLPDPSTLESVSLMNNSQADLAVSTHNLGKEFEAVQALDALSLEIPAGVIFGFLGPNGAGKTTTIRLLLGLLQPTSGSAQVLGFDSQTQADQIRENTGVLLEHTGIYEQMSAKDNLEFYGRAFRIPEKVRKERIRMLLTEMGLWDRRDDRAGSWSRGMKQKLALARAMLHKPHLVLLDEPTAGLDVRSAVTIREDLRRLAENEQVTVFLTSHNMAEVETLCSQIAVIQRGQLVAKGTPEELKARISGYRIEITGHGFDPHILAHIRNLPEIASLQSHNSKLTIELEKDIDLPAIVNMLVGAGAQIEEVRRVRASLEEVFLAVTGEEND
jgi:ABC-2 type transport system ATP-binding protein